MSPHLALAPVLVVLLASAPASLGGSLDLVELNTVQYNVEILDTPVADLATAEEDKEDAAATPSMTMVNKSGQKYRCSLPAVPEQEGAAAAGEEESAPDIAQLLQPMEEGPCMYKTKDWWTYEVCHRRSVRQYHVENDKPVGAIMVLGLHDPAQDNYEPSNATFLSQRYTNGTKCDLTGRPRQTELRFVCNEAAVQDFIGDIFEPQSCEYTVVVHTSRLCAVPWLRPVLEPTPLPIVCRPLLSEQQMEQYNRYIERRKLADSLAAKKKKEQKAAEVATRLGGSHLGEGRGTLDGLLATMGDSMADNLVSEISSLLDKAMAGEAAGGIKVIDLRNKDKKTEDENDDPLTPERKEGYKTKADAEKSAKGAETKASEGWDLVHNKHTPPTDPELRRLIAERNQLWRRIHEAKKLVKKYTSQLHDTNTFLENEKLDTAGDGAKNPVVERLEIQRKTIEKALSKARDSVAELEVESKDVAHKIVAAQSRLRNLNAQSEERIWLKRVGEIEELIGYDDNIFNVVLDMAADYKKLTNEWLNTMDEYFRVARKVVGVKVPEEKMDKLHTFMKTYEDFVMPTKEEVLVHLANQAELPEDNGEISRKDLATAAKFKDVVKDEVRNEFKDILKEVSEELDIPDGEVDKDEAMAAMTQTLDQLMNKLSGAGEKLEKVQKTVDNLKKISADKEATDEMLSLKRDNKKSVKKDLSQKEEDEDDGIEIDDEDKEFDEYFDMDYDEEDKDDIDEFSDEIYDETVKVLKNAEAEVAQLEKEVQQMKDVDNVKVSVTNMNPGAEPDEDTAKVVQKLEDTIKDKLSSLGLDTGGRPIEVKLITTQIPEGLGEGGEGEAEDAQVQGMFYNMMTGNIQGYEDINSQRKFENNYKFAWSEDIVEDVEKKISEFGEGESDTLTVSEQSDELNADIVESDDTVLEAVHEGLQGIEDFYHGGDQRQRPSSLHSSENSDSSSDSNEEDSDDGSETRDEL